MNLSCGRCETWADHPVAHVPSPTCAVGMGRQNLASSKDWAACPRNSLRPDRHQVFYSIGPDWTMRA